MLALRAVRGSGLLRAALDPAPSLKTRLRASQSLVDTFKRPSGATGHRIALGGPLRPPDGHSGPAWSSPAPASVVSRVGASSPARSALMLWRMARSSHSPSVWPSRWAAAIAAFLASAVTPRTDHGAGRGPFWQFSASIKSLQRKQCIIKKWSTQAYQKAYQIRPSPLRRKWSVQVAGAKRPATLPGWRNPGAECQRRRSRAEQPGATHSPQGEHGEDCEAPTL